MHDHNIEYRFVYIKWNTTISKFWKKNPKTNYFAGVGCDWLCIFLPDRKYKTPRDAELHKATFVCLFNLIRIRGNDSSPDDMQQEGDIKQLLLLRGQ